MIMLLSNLSFVAEVLKTPRQVFCGCVVFWLQDKEKGLWRLAMRVVCSWECDWGCGLGWNERRKWREASGVKCEGSGVRQVVRGKSGEGKEKASAERPLRLGVCVCVLFLHHNEVNVCDVVRRVRAAKVELDNFSAVVSVAPEAFPSLVNCLHSLACASESCKGFALRGKRLTIEREPLVRASLIDQDDRDGVALCLLHRCPLSFHLY